MTVAHQKPMREPLDTELSASDVAIVLPAVGVEIRCVNGDVITVTYHLIDGQQVTTSDKTMIQFAIGQLADSIRTTTAP